MVIKTFKLIFSKRSLMFYADKGRLTMDKSWLMLQLMLLWVHVSFGSCLHDIAMPDLHLLVIDIFMESFLLVTPGNPK